MEITDHTIAIHQVEQILLGAQRQGLNVDRILDRADFALRAINCGLRFITIH